MKNLVSILLLHFIFFFGACDASDSANEKSDSAYRSGDSMNTTVGNRPAPEKLPTITAEINNSILTAGKLLDESLNDSAQKLLQQALRTSEQNGDVLIGEIFQALGNSYYRSDNKEQAFSYYLKAADVYEKENNHNKMAFIYVQLADIADIFQRYQVSQDFKFKAIRALENANDTATIIDVSNYLSSLYLFTRHLDSTYLDSSYYYALKALAFSTGKNERREKMMTLFNNVSDYYYVKEDFNQAIEWVRKTIPYREYLATGQIVLYYGKIADCYLNQKKYKETLPYLDSIKQVLPVIKSSYYHMTYYLRMHECYKGLGDFETALINYEKYAALTDSVHLEEKAAEITKLERQYAQAKNEQKISDLKQQQEIDSLNIKLLTFGIAGAILLILLIAIFFRQNVIKNRQIHLEAEQRLNRARMNPHFFFNTLSALQTSALTEKDSLKIADLLAMYAQIMRSTLESTYEDLIPIEEEADFLGTYLKLQQFRTDSSFEYSITIGEAIDPSEILVPAMIIQPFVENAIEHGFSGIAQGGKLEISFDLIGDEVRIKIIDNGSGMGKSSAYKSHKSRATEITRDRLFLINKKYKRNANYAVVENPDGQGTVIEIKLPII
ncbi:MAG: hypothetical protein RL007_245 [Bacteroidota bacterium]